MKTRIAHYCVVETTPTLMRPGQVYAATTSRYFAKNKGAQRGVRDNTFREMCLGPTASLRHIES